jgi:hypothetical protein
LKDLAKAHMLPLTLRSHTLRYLRKSETCIEYFPDQNLMEVNSLGIGLLNFEEFKLKLRLIVAGFSFSSVLFLDQN